MSGPGAALPARGRGRSLGPSWTSGSAAALGDVGTGFPWPCQIPPAQPQPKPPLRPQTTFGVRRCVGLMGRMRCWPTTGTRRKARVGSVRRCGAATKPGGSQLRSGAASGTGRLEAPGPWTLANHNLSSRLRREHTPALSADRKTHAPIQRVRQNEPLGLKGMTVCLRTTDRICQRWTPEAVPLVKWCHLPQLTSEPLGQAVFDDPVGRASK